MVFEKGTIDQIWVTQQVLEKAVEYKVPVHLCFVDLSIAYDSVNHTAMLAVLRSYGVPQQLYPFHTDHYSGLKNRIRIRIRSSLCSHGRFLLLATWHSKSCF